MSHRLTDADLQSTSHAQVARALTDGLLQLIEDLPEHGGKPVADALRTVRGAVWAPAFSGHMETRAQQREKRQMIYKDILAGLAAEPEKRQFMEGYARLGHLYELAGLVARENVVRHELDGTAPGGLQALVNGCETADEALAALARPELEIIMTAHPTNVNSQASIRAQRELGLAIDAVRGGQSDNAALMQALKAYLTTPLLNHNKRKLNNLTVQDETDLTLYYLGNLYDDIPGLYREADAALQAKSADYDPLSLRLNLHFGSWGSSGDKDGNAKVTVDTTLDAIASHQQAILKHYTGTLAQLDHPQLNIWQRRMETALEHTEKLRQELRKQMANGYLSPMQLDRFAQELAEAGSHLDAETFEAAAVQACRQTNDPAMLDLVRLIRTFGFKFAKIEYRENADEYSRVVGELIPGYTDKTPDEREAALLEILQTPGRAESLYQAAAGKITQGAGKPYSAEDAAPIAYHTLKRIELARDFPQIIRDNVLAEFTHPSQLLEAVFLQCAVAKEGRAPVLGVIPLFESPEAMRDAPDIMARAYRNPVYRTHMEKVNDGVPLQQIQIAHSDNARRSGLPAARAFIFDAHRRLREAAEENGVEARFFEGGSSSDLYRGGVRATSTAIRSYGLYDFAKFTFQGGDLLNYLNYPGSSHRLFSRNLATSAAYFAKGSAKPASWQVRTGNDQPDPTLWSREQSAVEHFTDEVACRALKATLEDYQSNAFTRAGLGHLLKELEYDEEKLAGTAGSRAPARGAKKASLAGFDEAELEDEVVFGKVSSTRAAELKAVDIHKTRTITFSEALQHGGLVPTMVGARTIYHHLHKELASIRQTIRDKRTVGEGLSPGERKMEELYPLNAPDNGKLPPEAIHFFFDQSRLFRDVVVRIGIGACLTDFDQLRESHPRLRQDPFVNQLEAEYRDAVNLTCMAFTGKYPEELLGQKPGEAAFAEIPTRTLRHLLVDQYPEMQQVLEDKSRYLGFIQTLKADARSRGKTLGDYNRRLLHDAGDTVTHGRMLPADDPALGAYLHRRRENGQVSQPHQSRG